MKVTNWRKKLAATLVATGLMSPAAARAADLNTNLVVNPSFESVNTSDTGPFSSVRILNWQDSNLDGNATDDAYAFAFSQNYAGVNTPAGAGTYYFSGGFGTTDGESTITQTVNVSTGATGALIPAGEAAFNASAFFSSYLQQADASLVRLRFLNASATELGAVQFGGQAFVLSQPTMPGAFGNHRNWAQDIQSGLVPIGTASVAVDIVADNTTGNHDGYVDLVDFQISSAANILLFLEVNTSTGQVTVKNQTGEPVPIDYYEISSASGALRTNTWSSLQDQNLAGFPAGNGTGNGWEEAGGSSSNILSESFITGNSSVGNNASVNLGAAFNTVGAHDLVFQYAVAPQAPLDSDFDNDGDSDGGDFLIWQRGVGTTGAGATKSVGNADGDTDVDGADLAVWRGEFAGTGAGGPGVLQTGFVRYVTGAATAVPEPSAALLAAVGMMVVGSLQRGRNSL